MLEDVIRQPEMLPIDEISSQISAQIFEFCDHKLFSEIFKNSDEVTFCSNCCNEENSSYSPDLSILPDIEKFTAAFQDANGNGNNNTTATPAPTPVATSTTVNSTATMATNSNINSSNTISIIFDSQEDMDTDISASINFSPSPTFSVPPLILGTIQQDQFDLSSVVQPQISLVDSVVDGFSHYPADPVAPLMPPSLPPVFEEDCLSSMPSYLPMNSSAPSCSFLGPAMGTYLPAGAMNPAALSADGSGIFGSSLLMASELQPQELDYQGDTSGIFCPDSLPKVFNPGELQALGSESQQMMGGAGNSSSLAPDIPNMGDQTFKVGKLSVEQRKERIHRYKKKRNERNFNKKIKQYACRKTLADSRPRVRGRFAKNDDFGETPRLASSNHEEDDEEEVIVKEEDEMVYSSDIFAHISGVNSFKCNYPSNLGFDF